MTSRADNYNRADTGQTGWGTPSDGGSAWVDLNSAGGVFQNQGYCNAGFIVSYLEASSAVVTVQVSYPAFTGGSGPAARMVDVDNLFWIYSDTTQIVLFRLQSGSNNQLGIYTGSVANGDTLTLDVDSGDNWIVKQNGTTRISGVTDSFQNTATKHGIYGFSGGLVDDFSITDNGGGGGVFSWANYYYRMVGGMSEMAG